jgi:2,4-dienoyl-CoA reductase-like NADH-dependent reductase (Old Yellow Enzyme family)
MGMSLAHNVWAAEAVKKEIKIPVIASGSITNPELAESILADGKGDFIGLGRPLWADPQWPLKAMEEDRKILDLVYVATMAAWREEIIRLKQSHVRSMLRFAEKMNSKLQRQNTPRM